MADFGAGIPGQVLSELGSIPKQVVKETVKVLVGSQPTPSSPKVDEQKAEAAKKRLAQVRGELQAYFEEQKKKSEQEEQVAEEQKKMAAVQMKESEKKQEEKQILGRLGRQYGGTGEIGKSGN